MDNLPNDSIMKKNQRSPTALKDRRNYFALKVGLSPCLANDLEIRSKYREKKKTIEKL
jgi:hypothetical protein